MGEPSAGESVDVPDYVVGAQIGHGGFGDVYRARHAVLGREVAIKVLHARCSRDAMAVARFIAEARAVQTIDHPAIVDVFDFGQLADGRHYYVMELIRGRTLREVLRERVRLPIAEAVPLLRAIAGAVDAAHAAGIAHRDLKPDNVFVLPEGGVKLIDFGLAKLTRSEEVPVTETGAVFGSPHYMSPEQCRGRAAELSTDAYSFGVVAYELITGELPFSGEALTVALHHLNDLPDPPSARCPGLPAHVDAALLALLAKEPADRPLPLAQGVERLAGAAPAPRRRRALVAGAALAMAAAGAATVAIAMRDRSPEAAPVLAASDAPPPASRFEGRIIPLRREGQGGEPIFSGDGKAIVVADRTAIWRHDLAGGERSMVVPEKLRAGEIRYAFELPDGRWILHRYGDIADISEVGAYLDVGDPATGAVRRLVDGGFPSLSPDGTRIALVQDGWITVFDLRTGTVRRLAPCGTRRVVAPPRWSRDGAWLVWGVNAAGAPGQRSVQLTRASDGETRALPFTPISRDLISAAAFLDDGRVVYCARDGEARRLRAHDPRRANAEADADLAELPPATSSCQLDAAPGDRIAIAIGAGIENVGTLDTSAAIPEDKLITSERSEVLSAFDPIARRAYAYTSGRLGAADPRVLGDGTPRLVSYNAARARRDELACDDDRGLVWRGDRIEHVALPGDGTIRLRAHATCAIVEEWQLPPARWGFPGCGARDCYTLRLDGESAEVVRLRPGRPRGEVLARFPAGTDRFGPSVSVSPDERHLVALAGGKGTVHVITIADGSARPFAMDGWPGGVAWGATPSSFYVTGMFFEGTQYALRRVELDGRSKVIWGSLFRSINRMFPDGSAGLLASFMTAQVDFWLFRPKQP